MGDVRQVALATRRSLGVGRSAEPASCIAEVDGEVDRSFVAELDQEHMDSAIVQAVLSMADALGVGVVAEGVETAAQAARLRELGCDLAQGYYFGRPLSAEQADAWLGDPLHRPSGPGTLVGSDRLVAARPE